MNNEKTYQEILLKAVRKFLGIYLGNLQILFQDLSLHRLNTDFFLVTMEPEPIDNRTDWFCQPTNLE